MKHELSDRELEILGEIGSARQRNISVFAEMAELVDAESVGFKAREPGARDVTLSLIGMSLEGAPEQARELLRQVIANDKEVTRLTEQLLGEEGRECRECVATGKRSTVTGGAPMSTLLGTSRYWDKEGNQHIHDPNVTATEYSCSNGHKWTERNHRVMKGRDI